jgi:hypothetical protein
MPMWRCPHCGTPQAETARCWVCRRSSTACGTCRHFRRSVAAQIGFCGLDRRRQPLVGDEIRSCWEAWPDGVDPRPGGLPTIAPAASDGTATRRIEFVEIEDVLGSDEVVNGPAAVSPPIGPAAEPRWSLWGDPDR